MGINAKDYNVEVKPKGEADTAYVGVGCHLDYENLMHKGTRDLMGKTCPSLNKEDNGKRLKAKKFDNGSVTYVYSPTATDGRKLLNDAYDNEETDIKLTIRLSLDDQGTGTSPTYVERDVLVTSCVPVNDDDEYVEKATLEFLNAPKTTARVE